MPYCDFVGVDMKGRSIELFNDRARAAGLANVKCVPCFERVFWVVFMSPRLGNLLCYLSIHPLNCLSIYLSIYLFIYIPTYLLTHSASSNSRCTMPGFPSLVDAQISLPTGGLWE